MLGIAMVLGFIHIFAATQVITAERGRAWNTGARDDTAPLKSRLGGRLYRAQENFKETFPFFAALVLALAIIGRHSALTVYASEIYVAARIVYLPLYAIGVPVVRTLVWAIATFAIFALIAALFGAG